MKHVFRLIFLIVSSACFQHAHAQQSYIRAPRDSANNTLQAGLGEPYMFEPTATVTSYGSTNRVSIPVTGNDGQRQYRHMFIYNPDSVLSLYVCVGDSTGCTRDWYKARPGQGFIDDYTYFGVGNNKTYIYYRLSSSGSVAFDMRIW